MTKSVQQKVAVELLSETQAIFPEVVKWRRYLHANPELSFQEFETSHYIVDILTEFGYSVQRKGNGITARLKGGKPGKTIAFRADFDALPIQDLKTVEYASTKEGVSHACGHDGHTAALLGLAKVLMQHQNQLSGDVLLIFQHAEEKPPGGAKEMVEHNVLQDVDYVFAAHLDSSMPVGSVAVGSGFQMAAVDYFKIQVIGHGGHAARPHHTKDALVVGSEIVGSLQKIVSRAVDPLASAVVTIGQFHSGTAFNVIAQSAFLEGTVRTFNDDIRYEVKAAIERISKGIGAAHDVQIQIDYLLGYPALYNDVVETERVKAAFCEQFGEELVKEMEPSMGAEDFSYFLKEKPGTYFRVGSHNEHPETQFAHHHGNFDIDERALENIQKAFISIIANYLL